MSSTLRRFLFVVAVAVAVAAAAAKKKGQFWQQNATKCTNKYCCAPTQAHNPNRFGEICVYKLRATNVTMSIELQAEQFIWFSAAMDFNNECPSFAVHRSQIKR